MSLFSCLVGQFFGVVVVLFVFLRCLLHDLGYSDGSFVYAYVFQCIPRFADVFLRILLRSTHAYVFLCIPIYSDVLFCIPMYSYASPPPSSPVE